MSRPKPVKSRKGRQKWQVTKHKLCATFTESILSINEILVSDFASMDGARFYIGPQNKGILIALLAKHLDAGDYELSLVPTPADKTIFFADIDDMPADIDLNLITSICYVINSMI